MILFLLPPAFTLPYAFQNDVRDLRMSTDNGGVPNQFPIALSRISPRRLSHAQSLLHNALRVAQHHWNIFLSVHPLADEIRNDDNMSGFGEVKAFTDFGSFFEEDGVDPGVEVLRADQVGLMLNGDSRI